MNENTSMILEIIPLNLDEKIYKLVTISLNGANQMPFNSVLVNDIKSANVGDIGNVSLNKSNSVWMNSGLYRDHNYDNTVVLGINDKSILIYGNKIGEKVLEKPLFGTWVFLTHASYDIHRGDELLVKYNNKMPISAQGNKIELIHNITTAEMKYAMQQRYNKIH